MLGRRESRRKRRSRNCQTLISDDIDSLVTTAITDISPIAESLIEQSSVCRETPWSSEDNPSADSRLNHKSAEENSETTPSSDSYLLIRRRNLVDAALEHKLSLVKSSRSEGVKDDVYDPLSSLPLVGDAQGDEGLGARRPLQVMDSHKFDVSLYQ